MKNNKMNKGEEMKKKIEKDKIIKILRIAIILILMIFVSVLSFIGFSVIKNGESKSIIREYSFANDFDKYYEFVITPNNSARDEYVFVDENKNTVRLVPNNEQKENDGKVKLEEKKVDLEKIKKESGDEEVQKYTVEKRAYRYNNPEVLNEKGFKETKEKIKAMFAEQKISGYSIRENKANGKIIFEIPQSEVDDINAILNMISTDGKFQVVDSLTDREYLGNKDIKNVGMVNTEQFGLVLVINLTENGKETFKNITKKYADMTNKIKEEKGDKAVNKQTGKIEGAPEIAIKIGGNVYQKGSLTNEISTGTIQIPFGKMDPKDENYTKYMREANILQSALKIGQKPVIYDIESQKLVEGTANMEKTMNVFYIMAGIALILAISLIIFFGIKGLLSAISLIAYLALMLIIIRYTNIYITVSVIVGIMVIYILEFILLINMNKQIIKNKENPKAIADLNISTAYLKTFKETLIILISSVILSFAVYKELASFGKVVFLGILLSLIYNYFLTKNILKD